MAEAATIESIPTTIQKQIGSSTYLFLKSDISFSRTIDLLTMSQMLINNLKDKIFLRFALKREFSYVVAPAAKALEGALLLIALRKGAINQSSIDMGISIGKLYDDLGGKPAIMKQFILKQKDSRLVDKIYGDWTRYRNKVLHYDEDYFVNSYVEAEEIVKDIYKTIKLAYQVFIGPTSLPLIPLPHLVSKQLLKVR